MSRQFAESMGLGMLAITLYAVLVAIVQCVIFMVCRHRIPREGRVKLPRAWLIGHCKLATLVTRCTLVVVGVFTLMVLSMFGPLAWRSW